ncbi:MAG: CDP-diacylglycerol diphosphatase [Candidatus Acidiferrales bacterium]
MMTSAGNDSRRAVFRACAFVASIYVLTFAALGVAGAGQDSLPRNALWEVVHNVCVPGESALHNPRPCLKVDLSGGLEKGFAILKDPRGLAQFLVIPTAQISGIESPVILGSGAANYFADAWDARTFVNAALNRNLSRDGIGLAINSVLSRSQDQLHIHVACVQPSVFDALRKNQERIGSHWAPLNVSLLGRYYAAIWVSGEDLSRNNPFRLLAEKLPGAAGDMGSRTLVVIGWTRPDGTKGFVILTDRVNVAGKDLANGEELLDRSCNIADSKE